MTPFDLADGLSVALVLRIGVIAVTLLAVGFLIVVALSVLFIFAWTQYGDR